MQKIFEFNKIAIDKSQAAYGRFYELADLLLANRTADLPQLYEDEQNKKISESIENVLDTIGEMRSIKRQS